MYCDGGASLECEKPFAEPTTDWSLLVRVGVREAGPGMNVGTRQGVDGEDDEEDEDVLLPVEPMSLLVAENRGLLLELWLVVLVALEMALGPVVLDRFHNDPSSHIRSAFSAADLGREL